MGDAVLKIGAIVDKETIARGMAEGAGSVDDATTKMSLSFEELQGRAKRAWSQIAQDTRDAAAGVSAESVKVAETSKAVAAAKKEEAAASRLALNAKLDETETTKLLAAAQEKSRLAALEDATAKKALAVSLGQVDIASHAAVSGVQATSGAIRSLEGNAGLRAVENFISKTLGFGPAMQAIFPVVGAIAFGTILFGIGEKAYEVGEKAAHAAQTIGEAFGALHDRALITNDDLRIQIDKLNLERAAIGDRPGLGLQLGLDEAIKRADQLLVSLRADRKELAEIFKGNSVGFLGSALTGVAGTGTQEKELLKDNQGLVDAVRKANETYSAELQSAKTPEAQKAAGERHSKAIRDSFDQQIVTYRREAERLRKEQSDSEAAVAAAASSGQGSVAGNAVNNSAKIANIEGVIGNLGARRDTYSLGEELSADQGVPKSKKDNSENKEAQARLRSMEEERAAEEQAGKIGAKADYDFWTARLDAFKKGSSEYHTVFEKITQDDVAAQHHAAELIKKAREGMKKDDADGGQDGANRAIEKFHELQVQQADDILRTGERWDSYNREVAKGAEIVSAHNRAMAEAQIKALEVQGAITPLAAAERLAAIETQAHTEKLAALRAELERLRAEGASLKPGDKGYEQNQTKQQGAQNAITQEVGAGKLQGQQNATAINNAVAKPYLTAFDNINNGWLKVQNDLIQGNKNISRDFAQMGLGLVQSLAANTEKMIADWGRMEIRKLVTHQATQAAMTTIDAAGNAVSVELSAAAALKKQLHSAAVAAGKAWSAFADIPVVGPELGAVAAAATYAGVLALAAFEKGGIVGGSPGMAVPILAHSGERVLTATQTNTFERLVNNTTTGVGGSPTINFGGSHTYGGGGSQGDFKSGLRQHRMELVRTIKQLHREGHLNLSAG